MGNRKKIVASITGSAALLLAPFIHGAFSAAAADTSTEPDSAQTSETTAVPTNTSVQGASIEATESTTNEDKESDSMPDVTVKAEINDGHASVTVNGETTTVQDGDSLHKTVGNNSSTTTINVTNSDGNLQTNTQTTSGRTRVTSRSSSSVNVSTKVSEKETIH